MDDDLYDFGPAAEMSDSDDDDDDDDEKQDGGGESDVEVVLVSSPEKRRGTRSDARVRKGNNDAEIKRKRRTDGSDDDNASKDMNGDDNGGTRGEDEDDDDDDLLENLLQESSAVARVCVDEGAIKAKKAKKTKEKDARNARAVSRTNAQDSDGAKGLEELRRAHLNNASLLGSSAALRRNDGMHAATNGIDDGNDDDCVDLADDDKDDEDELHRKRVQKDTTTSGRQIHSYVLDNARKIIGETHTRSGNRNDQDNDDDDDDDNACVHIGNLDDDDGSGDDDDDDDQDDGAHTNPDMIRVVIRLQKQGGAGYISKTLRINRTEPVSKLITGFHTIAVRERWIDTAKGSRGKKSQIILRFDGDTLNNVQHKTPEELDIEGMCVSHIHRHVDAYVYIHCAVYILSRQLHVCAVRTSY